MKKLCLVLLCSFICVSAYAEETYGGFAKKLDLWVSGIKGQITNIDGKICSVDLGKKSGIVKGAVLEITRFGEELLHPITGVSLGKKQIKSGVFIVAEVLNDKTVGECVPQNGDIIKKGDGVAIKNPLPVKISFDSLAVDESAKAKYAFMESRLFEENNQSSYEIKCTGKDTKADCVFLFENKIIADINAVIELPKNSVSKRTESVSSMESIASKRFDEVFVSCVMGRLFGTEEAFSLAFAAIDKIYVYSVKNWEFTFRQTIEKDFAKIINIETADLNGNGKDEIFISHTDKKGNVASFIVEYDGTEFRVIEKDLKILFRSFYVGGKKTIINQSFADGDFTGIIYTYGFTDGVYGSKEAFEKTFGVRLYGFASEIFSNNLSHSFNFDGVGNFMVTSATGEKFMFGKEFGYTPNKLVFTKTLMTGTEQDANGTLISVYNTKLYGYSVYQRVIELEANPNKFFFLSNTVERRKDGGVNYLNSSAGFYMLIKAETVNLWKLPLGDKAVLEADFFDTGNQKYIAILSQKGKNGANFTPLESFVDVFEIK